MKSRFLRIREPLRLIASKCLNAEVLLGFQ
jgi:hypothetical protein